MSSDKVLQAQRAWLAQLMDQKARRDYNAYQQRESIDASPVSATAQRLIHRFLYFGWIVVMFWSVMYLDTAFSVDERFIWQKNMVFVWAVILSAIGSYLYLAWGSPGSVSDRGLPPIDLRNLETSPTFTSLLPSEAALNRMTNSEGAHVTVNGEVLKLSSLPSSLTLLQAVYSLQQIETKLAANSSASSFNDADGTSSASPSSTSSSALSNGIATSSEFVSTEPLSPLHLSLLAFIINHPRFCPGEQILPPTGAKYSHASGVCVPRFLMHCPLLETDVGAPTAHIYVFMLVMHAIMFTAAAYFNFDAIPDHVYFMGPPDQYYVIHRVIAAICLVLALEMAFVALIILIGACFGSSLYLCVGRFLSRVRATPGGRFLHRAPSPADAAAFAAAEQTVYISAAFSALKTSPSPASLYNFFVCICSKIIAVLTSANALEVQEDADLSMASLGDLVRLLNELMRTSRANSYIASAMVAAASKSSSSSTPTAVTVSSPTSASTSINGAANGSAIRGATGDETDVSDIESVTTSLLSSPSTSSTSISQTLSRAKEIMDDGMGDLSSQVRSLQQLDSLITKSNASKSCSCTMSFVNIWKSLWNNLVDFFTSHELRNEPLRPYYSLPRWSPDGNSVVFSLPASSAAAAAASASSSLIAQFADRMGSAATAKSK